MMDVSVWQGPKYVFEDCSTGLAQSVLGIMYETENYKKGPHFPLLKNCLRHRPFPRKISKIVEGQFVSGCFSYFQMSLIQYARGAKPYLHILFRKFYVSTKDLKVATIR